MGDRTYCQLFALGLNHAGNPRIHRLAHDRYFFQLRGCSSGRRLGTRYSFGGALSRTRSKRA